MNFTAYKQRKKEVGNVKPLILYLTRKIFNISYEKILDISLLFILILN